MHPEKAPPHTTRADPPMSQTSCSGNSSFPHAGKSPPIRTVLPASPAIHPTRRSRPRHSAAKNPKDARSRTPPKFPVRVAASVPAFTQQPASPPGQRLSCHPFSHQRTKSPPLQVAQPLLAVRFYFEEAVRLYSQLAKNSNATTSPAAKFHAAHHSLDHQPHHAPHQTLRI